MDEKKPYLSERTPPNRLVDVFWGDEIQHVYADGAARVMLGPQVSKIELTRSLGPKVENPFGEIDQRETFITLTMPTSSVVELCSTLLEQYGKGVKAMQAGNETQLNAVKEALKRVAAIKL